MWFIYGSCRPQALHPKVILNRVSCRSYVFFLLSAVTTVNTAMGLSTCSTYSLEDVARESPDTVKFFQIPFFSDRQLMETLIKRAEKAGYKAVLLTVDMPRFSKHKERASFALPSHLKYANFLSFQKTKGFNNSQLDACLGTMIDSSVDWGAFDWLKSITPLPIIVKGILTAEDARLAVQRGAQGILVSNHGGRKLDGSQATVRVMTLGVFVASSSYNYI